MTRQERAKWFYLSGLRATLSLLDLLGILAIGFVVSSTAIFLTAGSDPSRILDFAGLRIPAVNVQSLPWVSAGVLGLFLIKAFFSILLTKTAALFVATIEARAAKEIAEISFGGDLGDARKRSREEVMFAVQVGSPSAFNILLNTANTILTETMLFFVICIGFLFVDPVATFAAVIYFGIIAFIMQYFVGSLMGKAAVINARASVEANTAISDLISVFRESLVLGKRSKYIDDLYKARLLASDSLATQYYLTGMPRYIIEAALLVGVGLFVLGQALSGDLVKSATTIGVFLSGGFRLTAALLPLQNALLTLKSAIPPAMEAHRILRSGEAPSSQFSPGPIEVFNKEFPRQITPIGIGFASVSYTYPDSDQTVLENLSFEIAPGAQVAFMGASGAGKSTIADLICGVLTPSGGSIYRTNSPKRPGDFGLPSGVAYVPQRPGLVSGTILDNIALAENSDLVDRTQVFEALRLAHLSELISKLPDGLDTPLGSFQDGLSGGELQRLGLARALYTKPGLLVMDEATSALDAESEAEIQKAIEGMKGSVTVVIIAHRLNTIQFTDKVYLIQDGKVSDSGTLKELVSRNPSVEKTLDLTRVEKN